MSSLHDYFPLHSELPILVHMVAFGGVPGHSHPRLNYRSDDPAVIARQIAEIKSWGCDGIVLDWYCAEGSQFRLINNAAGLLLDACKTAGLTFALSLDAGALQKSSDPNIDLAVMLTFADTFFLDNPAYMRSGDKNVIFEFGMETLAKPIDWAAAMKAFPRMAFIHRN